MKRTTYQQRQEAKLSLG